MCKHVIHIENILPYIILVDEYYHSPSIVFRAQAFDYPVKILDLRVSQNLLADRYADVVFRRERNETGDTLKIDWLATNESSVQ